jgi:uncharacterized protein YecE (DUF72 family)
VICVLPKDVRIGTSGYSYPWNKGKPTPFAWYLAQGFRTVEINASYYHFPSLSWIKAWEIAPEDFDFAVKVNRSITHFARLAGDSLNLWQRFRASLSKLEERKKLSNWLFQMPPDYAASEENIQSLSNFFRAANLGNKAVVEFRAPSWWDHLREVEELGVAFCSVDAPKLPRDIISMNDVVYLRLHGRKSWYSSVYTENELSKIWKRVVGLGAEKKYIFLNNDHGMLPNGKYLMAKNSRSSNQEISLGKE